MYRGRAEEPPPRRPRTRSHTRASRVRSSPTRLSDLDRLDLVADLDAEHDVHPARHLAEVRIHGVQETARPGAHEPLGIVAHLDVGAACYSQRSLAERQVVQLGGLI